jgi:hypothetical protein
VNWKGHSGELTRVMSLVQVNNYCQLKDVGWLYCIVLNSNVCGIFAASKQRNMFQTASIAGGATIAVFLVVIVCVAVYIHLQRKQKETRARYSSCHYYSLKGNILDILSYVQ